jgi:hypothetical protein
MPAKKTDGDAGTSTSEKRASNCSTRLRSKARPGVGAGDHFLERTHHLTAVADAEGEAVRTSEESREAVARTRVEKDRFCPALAGAEHVTIGKTAAGDGALEIGEGDAAGEDVAHVHVDGGKAGAIESRGHFDVAVDALFAQDRHARARAAVDHWRRDIVAGVEAQLTDRPLSVASRMRS